MATSIVKADELRLLNDNVLMSNGALTGNVTFPAGHVIQTVTDLYNIPAGGVDITNADDTYFDGNLQVTLIPNSTSNKLLLHLYIPDCWNNSSSTRSVRTGWRYDTNGFNSGLGTVLGPTSWVSGYNVYFGTAQSVVMDVNVTSVFDVPAISTITIRPIFYGVGGVFTFGNNAGSDMDVAFLTVQEIQS